MNLWSYVWRSAIPQIGTGRQLHKKFPMVERRVFAVYTTAPRGLILYRYMLGRGRSWESKIVNGEVRTCNPISWINPGISEPDPLLKPCHSPLFYLSIQPLLSSGEVCWMEMLALFLCNPHKGNRQVEKSSILDTSLLTLLNQSEMSRV